MARTGRPSKIDQVVRHRPDGSPVTAGEQVVERVQLGMDLQVAADSAGISRSTLHNWRLTGARHRAEAAQGKKLTPAQARLADFLDALERAEAEAEANRLAIVQRAATGGAQVVKVTEKVDAQGQLLERTTVTETLAPQWTAAAWWLERRRGYVKRYELTGAEGAPADSLRTYLEGAAAGAQVAKAGKG
jgi:hypothetical protein